MKKMFTGLFAIAILMPMMVGALSIPILSDQSTVTDDDGLVTNTIEFSFDFTDLDDDFEFELTSLETVVFELTKGADVTYAGASDTDYFTVEQDGDELKITLSDTYSSKTFTNADGEVKFATVVITYQDGTDCSLDISGEYIESTPVVTPNVQTGVNVPLVALGVAGILAVGIYLTISKKNKIYNV